MTTVVTIQDRTGVGKIIQEINISFPSERVTVRDIIEARVVSEVENYNTKLPDYFTGLIQPTDAEKVLNGFKLKPRKKIDAEQQVYIALDAFMKNGYFILIDDKQAADLEQEVLISDKTNISFVKLTPLVGG